VQAALVQPTVRRVLPWALLGLLLLAVPRVVTQSYILDVLIEIALYIGVALSYDLVVGYVGSLSLAHPAFFGVGAYATALLATKLHTPFLVNLLAAALIAGLLALAIGIPSFRLSEYSFAIGTLGFATVAQIVAQNWIDMTSGPLCVTSVPRPVILGVPIDSLPAFYYLMGGMALFILLFNRRLIASRIGRSFLAVRENEVMARAVGINPFKYKMLAFSLGAAMAGGVGTLYAYYIGLVCPTDVALNLTLTLLVILFIGGSGSLRGVVLGAMLVTALPEVLRVSNQWRLVAYGLGLLLIINFLPDGLEGLFRRRHTRDPSG
jgi:ABC-type branched-subunit amino acid transport system permease subunit